MSEPPDPNVLAREANPFKGRKGMARLAQALVSSLEGIAAALRHESAFRQEVMAALVLLPIAAFVNVTIAERALLVGSVLLVLIVELLNSAIENAIDRIGFERHELSKRSKEMGSGAVLFAIVLLLFIWGIILLPRYPAA